MGATSKTVLNSASTLCFVSGEESSLSCSLRSVYFGVLLLCGDVERTPGPIDEKYKALTFDGRSYHYDEAEECVYEMRRREHTRKLERSRSLRSCRKLPPS
ncbi:hypothetical protein MRX96_009347 [Rhipicephalus microplus]